MTSMALLGYGFIIDLHTRAARAIGVDVVGVSGHHGDKARAFAERHGIPSSTDDWRAMVETTTADLVVVGTPNSLHHEQTLAALEAGRHVLVEKPAALSTAQMTEMIAAARRADRVLAVGHMWRYHPAVVALRDAVREGRYGRIVRTHGYGVHAQCGPAGWFVDGALAGGGALIDMGIHAVDTARFVLGDPAPVRVQASIGRGAYGSYEVDDDGLVIIDWADGVRSLVECGWWQPKLGGLEAETEVFGTKGSARIWPTMPPIPDGYVHCDVDMYARQLADVVSACDRGGVPLCSAEVGATALSIVELAYAAAWSG